jgi:two-component system chemotaxis sensor kinase CheA
MSSDEQVLGEARDAYLQETRDMLRQFEQSLLALEQDPADAETLNAAFRAAHTIKGSSGLFGYQSIVLFTHGVEAVMDAMRDGSMRADAATIALLLRAGDEIERMLGEISAGADDAAAADAGLNAEIRAKLGEPPAAPDAGEAAVAAPPSPGAHEGLWRIVARFGADALRNGFDPVSFIRYLPRLGSVESIHTQLGAVPALDALEPEACYLAFDIGLRSGADRAAIEGVFEFALNDCELILEPPAGAAASAPAGAAADRKPADSAADPARQRAAQRSDEARYLRVPADKLDHLIDLIGELVIAGSGARMVAQQAGSAAFVEAAQRIGTLVEAARDGALQLRMVQIGETFNRFHRVVRDNARKLGKEIELTITGGDTELDKSMVEMIADPLMHLVRNGIDHGLETPLERDAAGKPARGKLALNAYHDSGSIVIEVSDDGRGLDRARILAKAIERGLVPAGETPAEADIDQLIFAPGFSTAEAVTDISGRGVGMDVVKRNIEALRGTVRLATTPGRGTTTQIRLPLTLAIIDGFLVGVGPAHYIVPLESIVECVEPPRDARLGRDARTGYVDLRGEVLPFLDLRAFFGTGPAAPDTRASTVVVRSGPSKVGLIVDRLLGEYQTVIKPLGRIFTGLRGVAGSTILGSGDVALILDVPALVAGAARACGSAAAPTALASLP